LGCFQLSKGRAMRTFSVPACSRQGNVLYFEKTWHQQHLIKRRLEHRNRGDTLAERNDRYQASDPYSGLLGDMTGAALSAAVRLTAALSRKRPCIDFRYENASRVIHPEIPT
jgi:hypothetical protein